MENIKKSIEIVKLALRLQKILNIDLKDAYSQAKEIIDNKYGNRKKLISIINSGKTLMHFTYQ